ncbi:VIT family protein [Nocardioides sp. NPDC057772]|uniref:VIT1/CCC1 transporter family protein n=1 Tax=Nocardioides sp. NPDC057772 TaxID=3346245 RepID=UPI00366E9C97
MTLPSEGAHAGHGDAEERAEGLNNRLNWLRAGVLGANDGIVSTAGVVMGVAGATTDDSTILIAGVAALVAGAISMAAGEYVSVSTQRDTEESLIAKERRELREMPEEELQELEGFLRARGLEPDTAADVAQQLTERDALRAHAALELGIDVDDLTSPWAAAAASMISFTLGALLPLLAITLFPDGARVWATILTVMAALAVTGWTSARLGYAPPARAALRNVAGGLLAMLVTYLVGDLLGTQLG